MEERTLKEFNHIYREIDELYHAMALERGLSDSAFIILYNICELGDGCLQKDISRIACISKQTINSSIRKLEKEGYLCLEKGRGRDMHIHLTPAGQRLAEEKIWPVMEMEKRVFGEMSPQESRELLKLSRKYMELLKKQMKQEEKQQ